MNEFLAWLSRILDSWKFWVVIAPWEIGVRIRLGKRGVALKPGVHFRIPFVDSVMLVNTRLRIEGTPPITVSGDKPNCTRYISATIGFYITDPLNAMLKFGLPGPVVISKAQGEIATTQDEGKAITALKKYFTEDTGISVEFVKFVEDVEVRTYRIINGNAWIASGHESTTMQGTLSARY